MPRLGERQAWLKRGGRLSEVASPATKSVQVPVRGNIASFVYFLVVVYIRQRASIALGQRAAACEVCVVGVRLVWGFGCQEAIGQSRP